MLKIENKLITNTAIGKTVAKIRKVYVFENAFTSEEEEDARKRFEWVEVQAASHSTIIVSFKLKINLCENKQNLLCT